MITPNVTNMLCLVLTDANVSKRFIRQALEETIDDTFFCLTGDEDTSTNDGAILLASGKAGGPKKSGGTAAEEFKATLYRVSLGLAKQIVAEEKKVPLDIVRVAASGAKANKPALPRKTCLPSTSARIVCP